MQHVDGGRKRGRSTEQGRPHCEIYVCDVRIEGLLRLGCWRTHARRESTSERQADKEGHVTGTAGAGATQAGER